MWYKLVDKKPVPCDDMTQFERLNRTVGKTELPDGRRVSTVFLALDHNFGEGGDPILFETMVFGPDDFNEHDMERYRTYEEAVEGHRMMVEKHGGTVSPKDIFDEDDDLFKI